MRALSVFTLHKGWKSMTSMGSAAFLLHST